MNKLFKSEWIEIICGPMFSGKTDELLRKLNRFYYAKIPFITFKPTIDTRNGQEQLHSRNGRVLKTNPIAKSLEILEILAKPENKNIKVVAIDECQFFDITIIDVVTTLAKNGYHIIIACLDRDFKAKPFGPVPKLLALADEITKLSAICTVCAKEATFSERFSKSKSLILIGDDECYEPRCRRHHSSFEQDNTEIDNLFKKLLN